LCGSDPTYVITGTGWAGQYTGLHQNPLAGGAPASFQPGAGGYTNLGSGIYQDTIGSEKRLYVPEGTDVASLPVELRQMLKFGQAEEGAGEMYTYAGGGAGGAGAMGAGANTSQEAYQRYLSRQQGGGQGGQSGLQAQQEAYASLTESPGQKFIRERAQRNLLQNSAAIGGLGGGNVRSALVEQGAGFAAQDLENRYSRLQYLIGSGQASAAQQGQLGAQSAANIGNLQQQAGQARASGILGAQQANAQLGQQVLGAGIGAAAGAGCLGAGAAAAAGGSAGAGALFGLFSDERMKQDINDLDLQACFEAVVDMPLKSWRYLESAGLDTDVHLGPMAQEAPDMIRIGEMNGAEMLNLHDELMMIAGAIKFMKQEGMLTCH